MKTDELRLVPGKDVRLAAIDPRSTFGLDKKSAGIAELASDCSRLTELQEIFAAARSRSLLIVLQGMDSAGKDGAIKHVMSGVNPQGVDVYGFKAPTDVEVAHDFLWRCERVLPERGRIAIFNRSYYEEVIVVRVHEDLLARESATPEKDIWAERFEDINAFEHHLARNGTIVLKFFLHLSKDEQRKRLLARLDDEDKNWKFSVNDIRERRYWDEYQVAYERMLGATTTAWAPWYVIPADKKWFVRAAVASVIIEKLDSLGLHYPHLTGEAAGQLKEFRQQLEAE
ncbi:MAG TPA: polyphosphate kinase 2 family protein [Candidatus Lustribacter sp.]|nr:polyphosphate kinase 2 family protein [Candidatus Lustribacter sp.]